MFIDADIGFNPKDIITMLAFDKDVVSASYPKKSLEFGQLQKALKKNPDLPLDEYPKLLGAMAFNPIADTQKFSVLEPIKIAEAATGFLMITRNVFDRFKEAYPEYSYFPDHQTVNFDGSREIHSYFNVFIDPESRRTLSED